MTSAYRPRVDALVCSGDWLGNGPINFAEALLSDPTARFYDLGPDYHTHRIDTTRKIQNHISGLTALGFRVTLEPAA